MSVETNELSFDNKKNNVEQEHCCFRVELEK